MLPIAAQPPPQPDLRSLSQEALNALVERMGERPFRARQLFRWMHKRGAATLDEMTDLSKSFRERLASETVLTRLTLDAVEQSSDGTRKYRFRTVDGKLIESVYMPDEGPVASAGCDDEDDEKDASDGRSEPGRGASPASLGGGGGRVPLSRRRIRRTLCVSSQVGCAMDCKFCLTATMGLVRHLSPGEIVDQVHRVNADLRTLGLTAGEVKAPIHLAPRSGQRPAPFSERPLTNLVFMGMGEPLHNFDGVKASLELLLAEDGPNFSHRHVTVSTSGHVPHIRRLGEETAVKLAISLNATTDETRSAIMPINRKWDLAALMAACRTFPMRQGRRITFEYVLLAGVNDTDDDARRLAKLVSGIPAKVNLIPYNACAELSFTEPSAERVSAFRQLLVDRHITAVVRRNRGRDIASACGQLAVQGQIRDGRISR